MPLALVENLASLIPHNISTFWETQPVRDEVREAPTNPFCLDLPSLAWRLVHRGSILG